MPPSYNIIIIKCAGFTLYIYVCAVVVIIQRNRKFNSICKCADSTSKNWKRESKMEVAKTYSFHHTHCPPSAISCGTHSEKDTHAHITPLVNNFFYPSQYCPLRRMPSAWLTTAQGHLCIESEFAPVFILCCISFPSILYSTLSFS